MKTITLKHIEKAIVDISRGQVKHGKATAYAQRSVCGTACCIAGHANQSWKPYAKRKRVLLRPVGKVEQQ